MNDALELVTRDRHELINLTHHHLSMHHVDATHHSNQQPSHYSIKTVCNRRLNQLTATQQAIIE
jgi:hypothetical protein